MVVLTNRGHDIPALLAEKVGTHHMQIGQIERVEMTGQPACKADGVAIDDVVVAVERRNAQTDAITAPNGATRCQHLEQQAGPVLPAATIGALAPIGAVTEKLIKQIAVGTMHFDAIKARCLRVFRRHSESGNNLRNFLIGKHPRHDIGLLALGGMHLVAANGDGAGANRLFAAIERRMTGAPAMPDLQENPPAGIMDCRSDLLPARNMRLRVNTRFLPEGRIACHRHGRFSDQQTRAGPLRVMLGHQFVRDVAFAGAATRQRCHEHTVGRLYGTQLQW